LLAVADQFKDQLLTEVFGVPPQTVGGSPAALTDVVPPESNILGVGYGAKVTAGAAVEELAVRVYVRAKLPERVVPVAEVIPTVIKNPLTGKELPTDVIPVGDLTAFGPRPVSCGVSVGHHAITAGTLGCLVQSNDPAITDQFILSNNHVLANSISLPSGIRPPQGEDILEPGPLDGGTAPPRVAELTEWEPINFAGINTMDTAITKVLVPGSVERGEENPTLDLFLRLAQGLKVDLYEIFQFEHKGETPRRLRKKLESLVVAAKEEDLARLTRVLEALVD
jgi:hypothetical protein